jgi:zinc and cadmium transporter
MSPALLLTLYCALILVGSLAGGWLPLAVRVTHARMQFALSLVAGAMLGVGLLHLLPHAVWELGGDIDRAVRWMLGGFLLIFFIERFFHFHHHDIADAEHKPAGESAAKPPCPADHDHAAHEHHHHDHAHLKLSWGGAAFGLTLHTLVDGVALAASVRHEAAHGGTAWFAGLATFVAIFLHKPFDAMTISALMTAGGWSTTARHFVNALFALVIPAGVALFYIGLDRVDASLGGATFLGCALAFAAGNFLCIATSDLLPEVQFHEHDRWKLSAALAAGLALAWLIGIVEGAGHGHAPRAPIPDGHIHEGDSNSHDHAAHDHE